MNTFHEWLSTFLMIEVNRKVHTQLVNELETVTLC